MKKHPPIYRHTRADTERERETENRSKTDPGTMLAPPMCKESWDLSVDVFAQATVGSVTVFLVFAYFGLQFNGESTRCRCSIKGLRCFGGIDLHFHHSRSPKRFFLRFSCASTFFACWKNVASNEWDLACLSWEHVAAGLPPGKLLFGRYSFKVEG